MSEQHWEQVNNQHHLMDGHIVLAKLWYNKMYGWCVYCWTTPPAQTHVPTLEEAKALAVALVKLN